MEFGKLADIRGIDWTLPKDDPRTLTFLESLKKREPRYYIGAPAWGHRGWIGKIYPPSAKTPEFLRHYARHFNCIELNTSHYRIPGEEQTRKWREQVGADFRFCPKLIQTISHAENGLLDRRTLGEWFRFLEQLGGNRGPSFLQLPPYFDYSRKAALFHFLQSWPSEFPLTLELRHPSWFKDGHVLPGLTEYLQKRGIGMVITDVAGRRDVLHSTISAKFAFIRFVGNGLDPSDLERIQTWTKRLKAWAERGLQEIYFVVHQPDDVLAPETAKMVVDDWQTQGIREPAAFNFYEPAELTLFQD